MANRDDVVRIARTYLRDFPKFFQSAFPMVGRTYDLTKPNVEPSSLWVATETGGIVTVIPSSGYDLDERNGLIRLTSLPLADKLMVEGYHYEWLSDADLSFYADMAIDLNTHSLHLPLGEMAPAVVDVIGIHALVQALWGLLAEYSRDIDVITSEAVHIIASQRYRMVASLLGQWTDEYNSRAAALNIGLNRLEVVNLRRVSKTTGRLVPIYREREVGDYGPIERLWPGVPTGVMDLSVKEDEDRTDVLLDGEPPHAYIGYGYY